MFTVANIPLLLMLAGIVALLAGLFGGGITVKDYSIPKISTIPRVMSSLIGLVLIAAAVWLFARPAAPPPPAATPTSAAQLPTATATLTPTPEVTFTPPPTPTATATVGPGTPTPVPPTATPIIPDRTNPAGFIRYFFNLVTINRDYGGAWALMTRKYQKVNYPGGSAGLGQYWNGFNKVDIDSLQITQVTATSVDCAVGTTYYSTSGLATKIPPATYRLIFNGSMGSWEFDTP